MAIVAVLVSLLGASYLLLQLDAGFFTDEYFWLIFPGVPISVFPAILWLPTAYAIRRRRRQGVSIGTKSLLLPFVIEVILAPTLAWIADRSGLTNPAGLLMASVVAVSGIGSVVTYHVLGMAHTGGSRRT